MVTRKACEDVTVSIYWYTNSTVDHKMQNSNQAIIILYLSLKYFKNLINWDKQ